MVSSKGQYAFTSSLHACVASGYKADSIKFEALSYQRKDAEGGAVPGALRVKHGDPQLLFKSPEWRSKAGDRV